MQHVASLEECDIFALLLSIPHIVMRSATISLALAMLSLAPVAVAEDAVLTTATTSVTIKANVTATYRRIRHPQTPAWIGEYRTLWLRTNVDTTTDIPTCLDAAATDSMRLLSLQRNGTCPVRKLPTRASWYR